MGVFYLYPSKVLLEKKIMFLLLKTVLNTN